MARPTLDLLAQGLREAQHHYVDERLWQGDWTISWVSYSDVIGFAARCTRSEPAAVNTIVRFHRSVASARAACKSTDLRLFQFTDATFALTSSLAAMLRFVSTLQHHCLAFNSILLEDKDHPLAHHLLLIRTTIAHGRVLTLLTQHPQSFAR